MSDDFRKGSYLSKNGYTLIKSNVASSELHFLKKELVARPSSDERFAVEQRSFPIYIETPSRLYIPKMYALNRYGSADFSKDDYNGAVWDRDLEFTGSLYDYQLEPVNVLLDNLHEKGGGILSLKTGFGKTYCSLYVLCKLQVKTLVVVNKISLMNQWREEIASVIPDARVGIIQGQKAVVNDCDIVIGMLQSISKIDYPRELFQDFGCIIVDECHHTSSFQFSKVLKKVCCKYTIGLTATPIRADSCEYVFKWFLGDVVYIGENIRAGLHPILNTIKIQSEDYRTIENENTGRIQFSSMISELIQLPKRNRLIVEIVKKFVTEGRQILVMSDRRAHVKIIQKLLDNDPSVTFTYGLFIGGMKHTQLECTKRCNVILATTNAMAEGVSIKDLDTLFMITPKKFVSGEPVPGGKKDTGLMEQTVGRILRKSHTERHPLIIDIHDVHGVYSSQFNGRRKFYKSHFNELGYRNQSIDLDLLELDDITYDCLKTTSTRGIRTTECVL